MSRDLADSDYYVSHGGKIPVKWTAPEVIVCETAVILKIDLNGYTIGCSFQEVLHSQ